MDLFLNLAPFSELLKTIFPTTSQKIGSKVPKDTIADLKDTGCVPAQRLTLKPNP
jgi:hypothetical protein